MKSASIFRVHKKGYLLHALSKTKSGFWIASDPYKHIPEDYGSISFLVSEIKSSLIKDESERVPDPKDGGLFDEEVLQKMGLKSHTALHKKKVMYCAIRTGDDILTFIPTRHAERPSQGFLHKTAEKVDVPYDASDEEIFNSLEIAFSRCE